MRASKAKTLRRLALQMVQHGATVAVHKPTAGQHLAPPFRYLYQALKGRNTVRLIAPQGGGV